MSGKMFKISHRSEHRNPKKKARALVIAGSINLASVGLLIFVFCLTYKQFTLPYWIWVLRIATGICLLWGLISGIVFMRGFLLWLKTRVG